MKTTTTHPQLAAGDEGAAYTVPKSAVEAASAYMDGAFDFIGSPTDMRAAMREALEEAAPYMLATAWQQGATAGLSWDENSGEDFATPNPYMSQQP